MFQKLRNIHERGNLINENESLFLITRFAVLDMQERTSSTYTELGRKGKA